jgi:hypothetical protein
MSWINMQEIGRTIDKCDPCKCRAGSTHAEISRIEVGENAREPTMQSDAEIKRKGCGKKQIENMQRIKDSGL